MRASVSGFLLCLARDASLHRRIGHARLTALVPRVQPVDPVWLKPLLPARDRRSRGLQREAMAICR